jgi:hypothetical protein
MARMARVILLLLLMAGYLGASFGSAVERVMVPPSSSGAEVIRGTPPDGKTPYKWGWMQRRHMPLVKELIAPALVPDRLPVDDALEHHARVACDPTQLLQSSLYFSSLSDRGPPLH